MKHKLHHNTIVTSLTHCCIQCNNVTVVQFRNLRFLLQFKRNSANVAKINSINIILPEMHSNTVSQLGYQMKAHHLRQIVHFCLEQTQIIQLLIMTRQPPVYSVILHNFGSCNYCIKEVNMLRLYTFNNNLSKNSSFPDITGSTVWKLLNHILIKAENRRLHQPCKSLCHIWFCKFNGAFPQIGKVVIPGVYFSTSSLFLIFVLLAHIPRSHNSL